MRSGTAIPSFSVFVRLGDEELIWQDRAAPRSRPRSSGSRSVGGDYLFPRDLFAVIISAERPRARSPSGELARRVKGLSTAFLCARGYGRRSRSRSRSTD